MLEILKPIKRNPVRKLLGKEYFILKRKLNWLINDAKYSKIRDQSLTGYSVFKHKSMIMRPLKDVDMYLQENKRVNIQIAINSLNKMTLNPGEIFSVWKNVGRPTASKGYLQGLVLNQGQIEKGIGGGLCQLGNLLFWVFAHSPLTIVERHRHGFDVFPDINRKVPFGAGATLSYNYIDLQVINNTKITFQLMLWMDDDYLYGELIASEKLNSDFKVEERNHHMKQQAWGGYSRHNQIYKIESPKNDNKIETLLVENHALVMYNPFLGEKAGGSI